jgi:hypothetical protein
MIEEVNSTMIYCKNFYKCQSVCQYNNIVIKRKKTTQKVVTYLAICIKLGAKSHMQIHVGLLGKICL